MNRKSTAFYKMNENVTTEGKAQGSAPTMQIKILQNVLTGPFILR